MKVWILSVEYDTDDFDDDGNTKVETFICGVFPSAEMAKKYFAESEVGEEIAADLRWDIPRRFQNCPPELLPPREIYECYFNEGRPDQGLYKIREHEVLETWL